MSLNLEVTNHHWNSIIQLLAGFWNRRPTFRFQPQKEAASQEKIHETLFPTLVDYEDLPYVN